MKVHGENEILTENKKPARRHHRDPLTQKGRLETLLLLFVYHYTPTNAPKLFSI
jgi:hypothetical protein